MVAMAKTLDLDARELLEQKGIIWLDYRSYDETAFKSIGDYHDNASEAWS